MTNLERSLAPTNLDSESDSPTTLCDDSSSWKSSDFRLDGKRRTKPRWTALGLAGSAVYMSFGVLSLLPRSPIVPPYPADIERLSPYSLIARFFHGSPSVLVVAFVILLTSAFALFALALREAKKQPQRALLPAAWAVGFAILLVPTPPIASQDIYSYAAYGRMAAFYYENPYLSGPSKVAQDSTANFVGRMWWDMPSVYGPVMQGIAWACARVLGGLGILIIGLKAVAAFFFALSLWLLIRCAQKLSRAATVAVVAVGWNPLVLIHIVGGGHNDILVAAALLGGLLLFLEGHRLLAGVVVTLGSLVKVTALVPLFLYMLLVWRKREDIGGWQRVAWLVSLSSATVVAAYAPFWKGLDTLRALVRVSGLQTSISAPYVSAQVVHLGLESLGVRLFGVSGWVAIFRVALGVVFGLYVLLLCRRLGRSEELLPEVWGKALLAFCFTTAYLLPWYLVWPMLVLALVSEGQTFRLAMAAAFVYSFTQLPGGYVLLSPNIRAIGEGLGRLAFFVVVVGFGIWLWLSRAGAVYDLGPRIGLAARADSILSREVGSD